VGNTKLMKARAEQLRVTQMTRNSATDAVRAPTKC
jgi:hypothetical protein